jgi:hypothetical protein
VEREPIDIPDRPASGGYERPPRDPETIVPDYAAELEKKHGKQRLASRGDRDADASAIAQHEDAKR